MTTPSREEAPELKACPFCGVNGTAYIAFPRFETPWHIAFDHAEDCPLQGWEGFTYTTKAEATEAWNTRADLANREPSEGDAITVDSSVYGQELFGVLNAQGRFWTPLAFSSEDAARDHIRNFWRISELHEEFMRGAKIVPVRVQLTAIQTPEKQP